MGVSLPEEQRKVLKNRKKPFSSERTGCNSAIRQLLLRLPTLLLTFAALYATMPPQKKKKAEETHEFR